ncbi:MAG: FHA domain-containing protein [Bifidobacteriaceae bacterium]|jgi:hypothetical protein|nr:FHA domain-containing protein [Bifidobacteriaceae bacterium]
MKQCERGHFYDETRDPECRYCQSVRQTVGATVGLAPAAPLGKTVPVAHGGTPAPGGDLGKTVGVIKKKIGIDPPVAFAVVSGGPHRGEHFALRSGRCFLGRESEADIALPSDDSVSRSAHAVISYDPRAGSFHLAPGQGRGLTYHNGAEVTAAVKLGRYDTIEVGVSTLVFLPLCGPDFTWD